MLVNPQVKLFWFMTSRIANQLQPAGPAQIRCEVPRLGQTQRPWGLPIASIGLVSFYYWIGLREHLQESMVLTIESGSFLNFFP